jgi:hypothetical protein
LSIGRTASSKIKPYEASVLDALAVIWEAFNYQCGKLLGFFFHANIDSITAQRKALVQEASNWRTSNHTFLCF